MNCLNKILRVVMNYRVYVRVLLVFDDCLNEIPRDVMNFRVYIRVFATCLKVFDVLPG